jgi:hypothetical protein
VPTMNKEEVLEGGHTALNAEGLKFISWEDNNEVFEIQSGNYSFSSTGVKKIITEPYVQAPIISPADTIIAVGNHLSVQIATPDSKAVVHYSLDGTQVTESSPLYDKPLEISGNTVVKAKAFRDGYHPSSQSKEIYNYIDTVKNGIEWSLYPGAFKKVPVFAQLKPAGKGIVFKFGLKKIGVPKFNFALQQKSFIQIEKEGKYTFYISSNDGSKLYIDDKLVVDNDGEHGAKELSGSISLNKGMHKICAEYFQSGGGMALSVSFS